MDKKQLAQEELKKHFQSIIEDNRKYPPRVTRPKCNDCKKRINGTAKCEIYPNGIPKDICFNRETCEEFDQK